MKKFDIGEIVQFVNRDYQRSSLTGIYMVIGHARGFGTVRTAYDLCVLVQLPTLKYTGEVHSNHLEKFDG